MRIVEKSWDGHGERFCKKGFDFLFLSVCCTVGAAGIALGGEAGFYKKGMSPIIRILKL